MILSLVMRYQMLSVLVRIAMLAGRELLIQNGEVLEAQSVGHFSGVSGFRIVVSFGVSSVRVMRYTPAGPFG